MSWFDEQIELRRRSDQRTLEESLSQIAGAVLGDAPAGAPEDKRPASTAAICDILRYYHLSAPDIPDTITDMEDRLEYCLHPHGLMFRSVKLNPGWQSDAIGPMIGFLKEDGTPAAILPRPFFGYRVVDPATGRQENINRQTALLFGEDAWCFYRPLPLRKIDLRDVLLYLKNCLTAADYVLIAALTLAATILGMLMTNLLRALTGFVLESGSISLLQGTAAVMLSTLIATQLIRAARQLMMTRISGKASPALDAAMMMRLMNLPAGFFRQYSSGELSSRYAAAGQLAGILFGSVFSTGLGALLSLLYILQIFHYAPVLVLPALLTILAGLCITILAGLVQIRTSRQLMEKNALEKGISFELFTGIQKIKLTGAEKRAFARWGSRYAEVAALSSNPPMLLRLQGPIAGAISLLGTAVIYGIAVKSRITPSEYIAFSTAYGAVAASFSALSGVALSLAGIGPVLDMARPILETVPESSGDRTMVTKLSGNIELSHVSFRYRPNMPWVLKDLNLTINAGDYVAVVGATGCGKSTLARLLLGFETPDMGAVYYDGKNLSGLDLHSLRRRIGTVSQNGSLFQGDIYHNITISSPRMSLADAWEAAELAGIAEDIRRMPMGMQTLISEGGGGISGGQKQRIMIARAIAHKPDILIFDEATSALDNRTQKAVSEALDSLSCTRIVIAHRLSTIRNCSRILLLDEGRILEDGTYEELIKINGRFAELIERQRPDH